MKHCSWEIIRVKKRRLSCEDRTYALMRVLISDAKVCTLPLMKLSFISAEDKWYWTYVTDASPSLSNCNVGKLLSDGHNNKLRQRIGRCKTFEEVELG